MSNRKNRSIRTVAVRNRKLPCRIEGCGALRTSVGKLCRRHLACVARNGDPLQRHIKADEYEHERKLIEALFTEHREHPGIIEACAWIDRWLHAASVGEAVPGRREMARLAQHGVKGLAILTTASALYLFSRWRERTLPSDIRLTFAIGNAVLRLAPAEKRFTMRQGKPMYCYRDILKTTRRDVGKRIREHLAPILANAAEAVEAKIEEKRRAAAALHLPFTSG